MRSTALIATIAVLALSATSQAQVVYSVVPQVVYRVETAPVVVAPQAFETTTYYAPATQTTLSPVTTYHPVTTYRPVTAYQPTVTYSPVTSVATPVVTYSPVTTVAPVVAYSPVTTVTAYSPVVACSPVATTSQVVYSPVVVQPVTVGRNLYGQPTAYVPGQPVRNVLRSLTP